MHPSTRGGAIAPSFQHRVSDWPFTTQAGSLATGVPRRQEIEFPDGRRIWLGRVERAGVVDLFQRELGAPASGVLVDLRRIAPTLARDLEGAKTRDVPGLVHCALRRQFATLGEFVQHAVAAGRPA